MADPAFDYRQLPLLERLRLVEDIWDSIAEEATPETLPLSDAEKALLDERLAELETDPRAGTSWDEVRDRLLKHRSE